MKLKSIELYNIGCYKEAKVNIPDEELISIYGIDLDRNTSNGVGKSLIKEAILFALYGKPKVTLSEFIRKGAKKCKVVLKFESNGKDVTIVREYSKTTTLKIYVNNQEIDLSRIRELRDYINKLIEMDYDTFVNFSIFDAVRFEDLTSLSSSEIKRLLRMLFDYEKFNKIYQDLNTNIKKDIYLLQKTTETKGHYYSNRRLNILNQGLQNIKTESDQISSNIRTLNQNIEKVIHSMSYQESTKEQNKRKIGWIINKDICPTCHQPLKNKIDILNRYQQEIKKCDEFLKPLLNKKVILNNKLNELHERFQDLTKKQLKIQELIFKLQHSKKIEINLGEIEKRIEENKSLLQYLKMFESYVMQHYISVLEITIDDYLSKLSDISCKITLDPLKNKVHMSLYRDNKEFSYLSLSAGERMLVAYAFKLAINTINYKDTFLFIDEGFNRLDKTNRQKMVNMLKLSPFNQIFIISHIDDFSNLPTIFITKKNNESTIQIRRNDA